MGRRKIEIQPILHDRNRSVTFLKRKNGLFKKAYELGVLCSVDVLVVVFGHNQKLHEYCSSSNGNPNRILDRRIHFNGEREGRGPHDFSGDKTDAANDDNDNDNDNDDLDLGDESDEASRRPPQQSSSRSQMMQRQSSYSTRGRAYNSQEQHEGVDPRVDGGASDRAGAADSASPNVSYHIAQLLAAAVSGSLDPNRQQQQFLGGLYNDPSSHHAQQLQPAVNPNTVAAASSLGASLAQLLGANPYLASQLALPNLLSLGALGLNPAGGTGLPGFPGGAFNAPNPAALQNIHPLYSTPLFASLFQQQTQQQQPSLQNQSQSQLPPILFQNLAQPQNQTQPDDNRDPRQRPSSPRGSSLKSDWPVPPSSSRSRTPEAANVDATPRSQGASQTQASTFIDFLNAITTAGAPQPPPLPNQAAPASMPNQNLNSTAFGLSNYGGASTSAGTTSGQNPLSSLGLLGNLGLGVNFPAATGPPVSGSVSGAQSGFPPGTFGVGSNIGGGIGSSSLGPQEQRISMQKASRKRTRDGALAFDDLDETSFPLTSAVDDLPPRGLERYMNESEDGTSLGGRSRGTEDLNDDRKSDALQLDMGRATSGYEEDIAGARTRKRGRAS